MPAIKSAKKKLRQDKKRALQNKRVKEVMKKAIKTAKDKPTEESVRLAVKTTDKAAKVFIIHKNKAARIKSSLSKLIASPEKKILAKKTPEKKKTSKKAQ